jgi:hypothetical protein
MTITDSHARDLLRRGYLHVGLDGVVWRMMTKSRTGRVVAISPTRADHVDTGTGYRRVSVGKHGIIQAHRLVWLAHKGDVPDGQEINHKNLNKADNRIDNLELLTHAGNVQHAFAAGVVPALRGKRNGRSKLTASQVTEIRALLANGVPRRAIGRRFGVSHVAINHIAHGRNWNHAEFPQ